MTQTSTSTTVYRAWGKDRLSDPWTCFEARFRWQAEEWLAQRAFVLRCCDGEAQITEVALEGRSRIEWLVNGSWQPYTAWEDASQRFRQVEWIRTEKDQGSTQTFRIVIEDEPQVIVGLDTL
jgi:hypothetical protein